MCESITVLRIKNPQLFKLLTPEARDKPWSSFLAGKHLLVEILLVCQSQTRTLGYVNVLFKLRKNGRYGYIHFTLHSNSCPLRSSFFFNSISGLSVHRGTEFVIY